MARAEIRTRRFESFFGNLDHVEGLVEPQFTGAQIKRIRSDLTDSQATHEVGNRRIRAIIDAFSHIDPLGWRADPLEGLANEP